MPADGARFTSQESYFPVFDSSVKDLQALEADVVDNVTAFYTYMKVMRDSLRKLAEIHPSTGTRPCRRVASRDLQRRLHAVSRARKRAQSDQ